MDLAPLWTKQLAIFTAHMGIARFRFDAKLISDKELAQRLNELESFLAKVQRDNQ